MGTLSNQKSTFMCKPDVIYGFLPNKCNNNPESLLISVKHATYSRLKFMSALISTSKASSSAVPRLNLQTPRKRSGPGLIIFWLIVHEAGVISSLGSCAHFLKPQINLTSSGTICPCALLSPCHERWPGMLIHSGRDHNSCSLLSHFQHTLPAPT